MATMVEVYLSRNTARKQSKGNWSENKVLMILNIILPRRKKTRMTNGFAREWLPRKVVKLQLASLVVS